MLYLMSDSVKVGWCFNEVEMGSVPSSPFTLLLTGQQSADPGYPDVRFVSSLSNHDVIREYPD